MTKDKKRKTESFKDTLESFKKLKKQNETFLDFLNRSDRKSVKNPSIEAEKMLATAANDKTNANIFLDINFDINEEEKAALRADWEHFLRTGESK